VFKEQLRRISIDSSFLVLHGVVMVGFDFNSNQLRDKLNYIVRTPYQTELFPNSLVEFD